MFCFNFCSLVNRKFSSSAVASRLSKVFTVRYDSSLDVVDIQAASNVVVLYLVSKVLDFYQQIINFTLLDRGWYRQWHGRTVKKDDPVICSIQQEQEAKVDLALHQVWVDGAVFPRVPTEDSSRDVTHNHSNLQRRPACSDHPTVTNSFPPSQPVQVSEGL